MSVIHRRGVLLDGVGSELVRSANGGRRKTLSKWLADLSASVAQTFTSGDATPSVLNGSNFITAGSTTITDFDDAVEGQVINIYRGNADITITRNASLIETLTAASVTLTATHPFISFRSVSGVWQEVERADAAIKSTGSTTARTLADHLGDPLSFAGFSPTADGVTDDAAKFTAFVAELQTRSVKGYVPAGDYAISYVKNRTLTGDMEIEFHPEANIIGKATRQAFTSGTSLTVTAWTVQDEFRVTHVTSGGAQTLLVENTHYTVSGQVINLAGGGSPFGSIPVGDTIVVSDSQAMIELGPTSLNGASLKITGGRFDCSARGYAPDTDSGSALLLYNFEHLHIRDGHYYAGSDHETTRAALVGDSGISFVGCSNVEIAGNVFEGFPDQGVYGSGDNDSGITDDGFGASVHSNRFIKCYGGAVSKRQGQSVAIFANSFEYNYIGAALWPAAGNAVGARGVIHDNTFWRCGRTAVDCRTSNAALVHDNRIVDIGKKLDGTTTVPDACVAIKFLGVASGKVHDNVIKLVDFARDGQIAIQLAKETTFGATESTDCIVSGNTIDGLATGYSESNAGTGNVWCENTILNTTTAVSVLSARRWHYRASNVEHDGIGSTEFEGTWTPTVTFAGASPTITHVTQVGRYVRRGNVCWIQGFVQFSYSGSVSSNQLRVGGLPYTSKNTTNQNIAGSLGYFDTALVVPANTVQITPKIIPNVTYVRFDALRSGAAPLIITSDDVTASTNLRLEFAIAYEVATEAQN